MYAKMVLTLKAFHNYLFICGLAWMNHLGIKNNLEAPFNQLRVKAAWHIWVWRAAKPSRSSRARAHDGQLQLVRSYPVRGNGLVCMSDVHDITRYVGYFQYSHFFPSNMITYIKVSKGNFMFIFLALSWLVMCASVYGGQGVNLEWHSLLRCHLLCILDLFVFEAQSLRWPGNYGFCPSTLHLCWDDKCVPPTPAF